MTNNRRDRCRRRRHWPVSNCQRCSLAAPRRHRIDLKTGRVLCACCTACIFYRQGVFYRWRRNASASAPITGIKIRFRRSRTRHFALHLLVRFHIIVSRLPAGANVSDIAMTDHDDDDESLDAPSSSTSNPRRSITPRGRVYFFRPSSARGNIFWNRRFDGHVAMIYVCGDYGRESRLRFEGRGRNLTH